MSDLTLTKTRVFEGVWEGQLTREGEDDTQPDIEVTHLSQPIAGVEVIEDAAGGSWAVRVPIPAEMISDGVQTFVIRDRRHDVTLDSFALMAGEALNHDMRAEMALLREELDLLKRAFRRHCLETS